MRTLPWIAAIAGASLLVACGQKEEAAAPAAENVAENVAAPAGAAADPAAQIKAREDGFKQIAKNMKTISDELKKDAPDVALIQTSAAELNTLAPQVKDWFPAGTGPESGLKTEAKAEIWTQQADFATKHQALVDGVTKLNAAGGDLAAIKAAMPAVGGACKGCHDVYKVDDKK